jgi:hypothetical protein
MFDRWQRQWELCRLIGRDWLVVAVSRSWVSLMREGPTLVVAA